MAVFVLLNAESMRTVILMTWKELPVGLQDSRHMRHYYISLKNVSVYRHRRLIVVSRFGKSDCLEHGFLVHFSEKLQLVHFRGPQSLYSPFQHGILPPRITYTYSYTYIHSLYCILYMVLDLTYGPLEKKLLLFSGIPKSNATSSVGARVYAPEATLSESCGRCPCHLARFQGIEQLGSCALKNWGSPSF